MGMGSTARVRIRAGTWLLTAILTRRSDRSEVERLDLKPLD
jgi:hypothetical protein